MAGKNQTEHATYSEAISVVIDIFLRDRRSRKLAEGTIRYYRRVLQEWRDYLHHQGIYLMDQITPDVVRGYMLHLEEHGHNAGGASLHFRGIKALSRFWWEETDFAYRDPFRRVRPPKVVIKPIPGVPVEDVVKMVDNLGGRNAERDKALLLTLLDTGARRGEFCAMNVGDVDLDSGTIKIRKGKGDKDRVVFIGKKARRALRRYLRERGKLKPDDPLWINEYHERFSFHTLRHAIKRRAMDAGLEKIPGIHDFRRAFCLSMHRNGADNITISRQMGHASLEVMKRYLAQDEEDLRRVHNQCSPVDNADF
jgi:site-specific recombinase XerD